MSTFYMLLSEREIEQNLVSNDVVVLLLAEQENELLEQCFDRIENLSSASKALQTDCTILSESIMLCASDADAFLETTNTRSPNSSIFSRPSFENASEKIQTNYSKIFTEAEKEISINDKNGN